MPIALYLPEFETSTLTENVVMIKSIQSREIEAVALFIDCCTRRLRQEAGIVTLDCQLLFIGLGWIAIRQGFAFHWYSFSNIEIRA